MHHSPLVKELRAQFGAENVISAPSELAVYDCDAFTAKRNPPEAVVFPRSTEQVAAALKIANRHGVAIVPRGAGTGLAGACLPLGRSLVLMLTRMNRVLEISLRDRWAVVEAGVSNKQLSKALAGAGCCFAPDPSEQGASTIGGNVAANAGGPHSLKYGTTVNHVFGLEAVLSDGSIAQLGPLDDPAGLDLVGLLVGSEGTLGVVTKVWVRLTTVPEDYRAVQATFDSVDDALNAATQIISAGIIPTIMELIDQDLLTLAQEAVALDFPHKIGTVLLIEFDGPTPGLDRQGDQIIAICKNNKSNHLQQSSLGKQGASLWKYHKSVVGAIGRLSSGYLIADVVVPRSRLPFMLCKIAEIGRKHEVPIVSLACIGDGSLYPIMLFDQRNPASAQRALAAGGELLAESIACGGSLSAEHGIGVQKLDFMSRLFKPVDLRAMQEVRYSFDPLGRFNPGKLLPPETGRNDENRQASASDAEKVIP